MMPQGGASGGAQQRPYMYVSEESTQARTVEFYAPLLSRFDRMGAAWKGNTVAGHTKQGAQRLLAYFQRALTDKDPGATLARIVREVVTGRGDLALGVFV